MKKISEFKKSGRFPFSLRYKNKKYNIRHPKFKTFTIFPEHPLYYQLKPYNRISEAKPDIDRFSTEAYIEKASISRYKYERCRSDKLSDMANYITELNNAKTRQNK